MKGCSRGLSELDQQLRLSLHQDEILPTRKMRRRRCAFQSENPKHGAMDMEQMRHADRYDFLNLARTEFRLDVDPVDQLRNGQTPARRCDVAEARSRVEQSCCCELSRTSCE
jgi:hypothetical protein